MNKVTKILALALVSVLLPAGLSAAKYQVDPVHSKVGFSIRHMVSTVSGAFTVYTGTFQFDPQNLAATKGTFIAKSASVTTRNEKRDGHLRSPDFFDVKKYPEVKLVVRKVKKAGLFSKNKYRLTGDLTIRGITKKVEFQLVYNGIVKDPWGYQRAGFKAVTRINRKDFGVSFNKTLDQGSLLLGDEVDIVFNIEAIQPKKK